jgi:photosystem II stability/assembly factor-like uncharacterized protein
MLTGQGLIARSTDGGLNWDSLYQASSYEDFFDVHFMNTLEGIVIGGDESDYSPIILKTTDGGLSWNPVSAPANSYYLRAADFVGNEGWVVGRFGTIIYTSDGGDSWTPQTSSATNTLFDVDFSDNLHGITCGYDAILYTTDGGQNWEQVGIEENSSAKAVETRLEVHPNPFTRMTDIKFQTPISKPQVKIYNSSGQLVKHFNHLTNIKWRGDDNSGQKLPSGIYFVKLLTPKHEETEKVILLR